MGGSFLEGGKILLCWANEAQTSGILIVHTCITLAFHIPASDPEAAYKHALPPSHSLTGL